MSVKAGLILDKVRLQLNDSQKTVKSDWEIFQYISDALREFAEECARVDDKTGTFTAKTSLVMSAGGCALPEEFIKISRAFGPTGEELLRVFSDVPKAGEFAMRGTQLLSGETSVTLYYYCYPAPVNNYSDMIAIPNSMLLPFSVFLVPFFGVTNFMTSTAAAMFLPTAVSVVWLIVAVGNWIHNWKNV